MRVGAANRETTVNSSSIVPHESFSSRVKQLLRPLSQLPSKKIRLQMLKAAQSSHNQKHISP